MTTRTVLGQPMTPADCASVLRAIKLAHPAFQMLTAFQQVAFLKIMTLSVIGSANLGNTEGMLRDIGVLAEELRRQTMIDCLETLPVAGHA